MRIVVIGAGVLGSLYGARLATAGQSVTLVARGGRLTELQRGPIRILNEEDGATAAATVEAVSSLQPDGEYDLALVMVRADQIDNLLPELAANRGIKRLSEQRAKHIDQGLKPKPMCSTTLSASTIPKKGIRRWGISALLSSKERLG